MNIGSNNQRAEVVVLMNFTWRGEEFCTASGRFFYSANSGLYRATGNAFRAVDQWIYDENVRSSLEALDDRFAGPELRVLSGELKLPSRRPHPEPVLTLSGNRTGYTVDVLERAGWIVSRRSGAAAQLGMDERPSSIA